MLSEVETIAAEVEALADATQPVHGQGANDGSEAPWAEPVRRLAVAVRLLDARLAALEARPSMRVVHEGAGAAPGSSWVTAKPEPEPRPGPQKGKRR